MKSYRTKMSIFVIGLLLICDLPTIAQNHRKKGMETVTFSDSSKEIVDFTKTVEEKSTESLQREVGKNTVLIKFQPEFRNEAEQIMNRLESTVRETQEILYPLEIEDVRFYILQVDEVPTNYKIRQLFKEKSFYLQFLAFKKREELNLTDCNTGGFCADIFRTLPHELTHGALNDLITHTRTRWFDDGLSNFIGNSVFEKLSPVDSGKQYEDVLPAVALFRRDIRESLLLWKEATLNFLKISQRELGNESYRYVAAYELMRQIVVRSKNASIENPLGVLLAKLKERREKLGEPASTDDLIAIIRQNLKVDPKAIGDLDDATQKAYADEALSLLSQDDLSVEKKNYALYILAGIDRFPLSDKWMNYLLDEVYRRKTPDDNQRDIAATALAVRFNMPGFDALLKNYLAGDEQLKRKSVKKAKSELSEFSLRPPSR